MTTSDAIRLEPLPDGYTDTRDALHRLAAYVLAPARKAATGRIGLRPTPAGFGTPPFGADEQLLVQGATLVRRRGADEEAIGLTSLAAAAAFAGVSLSEDPGVGTDPPPLGDADLPLPLPLSAAASHALGVWYGFSALLFQAFRAELQAGGRVCSEAQLWPEHFDLGCSIEGVNFGCSPGDRHIAEPYVYVGPWNTAGLADGEFWNVAFGAALPYEALLTANDQLGAALRFLRRGADLALARAVPQP